MNRVPRRRPATGRSLLRPTAASVLALAFAVTASGCAAANEAPTAAPSGGGNSPAAGGGQLSGTLNGAGSSAQEAAMAVWQSGFQSANPNVTVNYDPVGSGGGREQFVAGGVDFAGSDAYLDNSEGELSGAKKRCNGQNPIEIPDYVSPIAIVYNLPGVSKLQLSADTVARIFRADITKWNDPAIAADNPGATLPADTITPVHRSDESGTTENFTAYLNAAAGKVWKDDPSGVWPLKSGEAAQGTSGVVSAVQQGSGTIGYADASQAGNLGVAAVKVGSKYVGPTPAAAAKILEISPRVKGRPAGDLAFDLNRSTSASGVYPVVLTSYLIACPTYADQQTADLVKGFLTYVISPQGQQAAAKSAGSAPLPSGLQKEALGIVKQIAVQG